MEFAWLGQIMHRVPELELNLGGLHAAVRDNQKSCIELQKLTLREGRKVIENPGMGFESK